MLTTVIFYGDKNNWWVTYALWVFQLFGHQNVQVMDGGRENWEDEVRPMTTEVPSHEAVEYPTRQRNDERVRALQDDAMAHLRTEGRLVDVGSPDEFRGEKLHMPDHPQ